MTVYRIFEIEDAPRISDYDTYGGEQWFGKTRKVDGSLIGEYDVDGPADTTLLPAYGGTWPLDDGRDTTIAIPTIDWLRDHLGEDAEYAARVIADSNSGIKAFIQMIDTRMNDDLIVSDPLYETGILLLESSGAINDTNGDVTDLLALGGYTR